MKFFVLLAAIVATASAQATLPTCDTTKLLPLLQDPNLTKCTADSGLTLPPTGAIDKATLTKACTSTGCQGLLKTVLDMKLGDCQIAGFKIESDLIKPLQAACSNSAPKESGSTAGSASSAATVTMAPTMEPTTAPTSGSSASSSTGASSATTTAPAAGVPTPTPTTASAASAVTVAAGAAVAAVAASLW